MMLDPRSLVQQLIQMNPSVMDNPNSRAMAEAILNNDSQTGMRLAQNLCRTRGIDPQQTAREAPNIIAQMFQNGGRR